MVILPFGCCSHKDKEEGCSKSMSLLRSGILFGVRKWWLISWKTLKEGTSSSAMHFAPTFRVDSVLLLHFWYFNKAPSISQSSSLSGSCKVGHELECNVLGLVNDDGPSATLVISSAKVPIDKSDLLVFSSQTLFSALVEQLPVNSNVENSL